MRTKIPCSAERLSLLDPPKIKSVVDRNAFQLANQYRSENRVRIIEADDAQISSAVIGNTGLYEQTIRLKGGLLISQCSCALPEEPICRHCIAVLLEYHRWAQPSSPPQPIPPTPTSRSASAPSSASTTDLKLGEVMAFVEWLQPAIKALERGQALPNPPKSGGDLAPWIQAIRNLEEICRESEEARMNLESDLRDREACVGRLKQQVQASMNEVKVSQANAQQLQQDLTACKERLAKVSEIASEVWNYDSQLKSFAGEIMSKGSQLDRLTHSFKEVSAALKSQGRTSATP